MLFGLSFLFLYIQFWAFLYILVHMFVTAAGYLRVYITTVDTRGFTHFTVTCKTLSTVYWCASHVVSF